jgi:hypothetical protein
MTESTSEAMTDNTPQPVALNEGQIKTPDPELHPDQAENDSLMRSLFFQHLIKPEDYPAILAAPEDPGLSQRFQARQRAHLPGFAQYMRASSRLLAVNEDSAWLLEQLRVIFQGVNQRYYHFELGGSSGPPGSGATVLPGGVLGTQIMTFETGQDLDWNVGIGGDVFASRKLSLIAFLTPLEDYDGGEFELMASSYGVGRRAPGMIAVFPSFVVSRIHPVTRGRMQILLSWMHGPGQFA